MTAGGDASPQLTFTNHLGPDDVALALRADVASGLAAEPKRIPPKWFYDETGSELFDKITRLDEYYPTEAERSALQANADEIVALSGADTVLELGSGSSDKTRT
ncbi:MAG TPA: L-histidine N(alpha)-methyltransferase, partial [Microthrixaceae bacterium]|nr:L-histidine N(alpha)-methyltransferase [Microthrixaceae bacterium]